MALSDNIWWTRKAKIQAEQRLLANAFQSQIILLWYSFFSVAVSVYYLKFSQNNYISISWVVYSVLTLCMSGFVSGLSFKERANLIKECYESLNTLYHKVESNKSLNQEGDVFISEYEQILNACENHTSNDYIVALCKEYWSTENKDILSSKPVRYQIIMIIFYYTKRFFLLAFFYLLPIIIFGVMNYFFVSTC